MQHAIGFATTKPTVSASRALLMVAFLKAAGCPHALCYPRPRPTPQEEPVGMAGAQHVSTPDDSSGIDHTVYTRQVKPLVKENKVCTPDAVPGNTPRRFPMHTGLEYRLLIQDESTDAWYIDACANSGNVPAIWQCDAHCACTRGVALQRHRGRRDTLKFQ